MVVYCVCVCVCVKYNYTCVHMLCVCVCACVIPGFLGTSSAGVLCCRQGECPRPRSLKEGVVSGVEYIEATVYTHSLVHIHTHTNTHSLNV
jgi:hypothetical protein